MLLVSGKGHLPTKPENDKESAGYDLKAYLPNETVSLKPGERKLISTGLSMTVKGLDNYYIRIAPRSGLAVKKGLDILAGVVDKNYRGIVHVALINFGSESVTISDGDPIAQAIIELIAIVPCEKVENLDNTLRGENGFGSSGCGKIC